MKMIRYFFLKVFFLFVFMAWDDGELHLPHSLVKDGFIKLMQQ